MKEDSEKVPSLLTDYILKGEFYNGIGAMAGRFGLVRKYIVLLIHSIVTSQCTTFINLVMQGED